MVVAMREAIATKSTGADPLMTHLSLKLDRSQNQALTPRLQYAVRLLQLSSLEYEQELHEVMGRNPFLEADESAAARLLSPGELGSPEAPANDAVGAESIADHSDTIESEAAWERDSWLQPSVGSRDGAGESDVSATERMVADIGLREHLRSQANMLPLSRRDHVLVCAVVESLDDDGYLRLDLAEIARLAELDPPADLCEMSTALKLVQSFEPAGVGARSVCECLVLQLDNVDAERRELGRVIVEKHLDRLAQRDVPGMAKLLGRPAAEIEAVCTAVRRLDPRPGWRFGRSDVHFVTPDVVARKLRGKWVAQLNSAVVPRLRLNQAYAGLFQRHREARHAELGAHLQEARWAIRNVEQRFSTILAVSQAILRRQYRFFEHGPLAMKPLALREIAEEVGVHESTVCRVTNNKYMATPAGLFELKRFFSRPMPMSNGGACSPTAIRGVVKALIDAESPAHPLSDVDIAQRLARQGLTVARRTVTKYRQMLKIPPIDRRRCHVDPIAAPASMQAS